MEVWQSELGDGRIQSAWDHFVGRYQRLILATIRRFVADEDDVMDVFAAVCDALSANDCARLRTFSVNRERPATAATWLVVVVRNLAIDWLRREDGRRDTAIPPGLSPLQREIFRAVCLQGVSRVEAYEMVNQRLAEPVTFGFFLREVRETHRVAPCLHRRSRHEAASSPLDGNVAAPLPALDGAESSELARRIAGAMAAQPKDVQLALQLFVVERLSATEVARAVGWPNDKAVYNRVHRALAALRTAFERQGIGRGDLA